MEHSRRLERERVLELLYEAELKNLSVAELLADLPTEPEPFVRKMVEGVTAAAPELDVQISDRAINWDLGRIAVLDRLILRMGIWELQNMPETPKAVAISEAVELAKGFSTEASGKFVNGILGTFQDR
jgi:N utilization substance protein B